MTINNIRDDKDYPPVNSPEITTWLYDNIGRYGDGWRWDHTVINSPIQIDDEKNITAFLLRWG